MFLKFWASRVPVVVQQVKDTVLSLNPWPRSGIAISCSVSRRHILDPALQWLWCRPAAAAPILPLAQELPYAAGAALKKKKKEKKYVGYGCAFKRMLFIYSLPNKTLK